MMVQQSLRMYTFGGLITQRRFIPALETLQQASNGRLELVFGDMLQIDERDLLKDEPKVAWEDGSFLYYEQQITINSQNRLECPIRIVGNLPFAVATELLLKWLRQIPEREGPFAHGTISARHLLSQTYSSSFRQGFHDSDVPA